MRFSTTLLGCLLAGAGLPTSAGLAVYDGQGRWTVEPGRFTVTMGAPSEAIRLAGNFTVASPEGAAPFESPLPDGRMDPR